MPRKPNGSTAYLSKQNHGAVCVARNAGSGLYPYTICVWVRQYGGFPNGTQAAVAFHSDPINGNDASVILGLSGNGLGTATRAWASLNNGGGSSVSFNTTATFNDALWHLLTLRCVGATDRSVFLDGADRVDNATNVSAPNAVDCTVGYANLGASGASHLNSQYYEIGPMFGYNVALTNDQIQALGWGAHPYLVSPSDLAFFHPFNDEGTSEPERLGAQASGAAITLASTGTTTGSEHYPPLAGPLAPWCLRGSPGGKHRMFAVF